MTVVLRKLRTVKTKLCYIKMMKSVTDPTKSWTVYQIIAVILATEISIVHGQVDFFRNNRKIVNRSPSARCKWIYNIKNHDIQTQVGSRKSRLLLNSTLVLSLFTIYQWQNGLCAAATGEFGMCLPENDCVSKRGILGGPCAQGYGICCVCKCEIFASRILWW